MTQFLHVRRNQIFLLPRPALSTPITPNPCFHLPPEHLCSVHPPPVSQTCPSFISWVPDPTLSHGYSGGKPQLNSGPQSCPSPNPWSLFLHVAEGTMLLCLRILRWGDDAGLFEWAPNVITRVPGRRRQGQKQERGHQRLDGYALKMEEGPQAKEGRQLPEDGRDTETGSPEEPFEGARPVHTLTTPARKRTCAAFSR